MIEVYWGSRIIYVPKDYDGMSLVQLLPQEIYDLNCNQLHLDLRDLEDSDDGMPALDTHWHQTELTFAGITFARLIQIINGYTVTFEDGQYAVNLQGANTNIADVTNVNQVSVRSFNSAGLISMPDVEYASFNGGVTVNVLSPYSGTIFPTGTPRQPVNNMVDAMLIAEYRGLDRFYIIGDIVFDSDVVLDGYIVFGQTNHHTTITFSAGCSTEGSEFHEATLQGTMDGSCEIVSCTILDLAGFSGEMFWCLLKGEITLLGSSTIQIMNCVDGLPGPGTPVLNVGSGMDVGIWNYTGGLQIQNKTGDDAMSINLIAGRIILTDTVTDGDIIVRGVGQLIDNSDGANVQSTHLVSRPDIVEDVEESIVEGSVSLRQAQRLALSVLAGKSTGGNTTNIKFRDTDDTKNRVDETVDENGNRLSVSLDLS